MASRPSSGRLPCAARPWVSTATHWNPLWATATSRLVGSVTTAASARQVRTSASAPRLECSSSTTAATISSPLSRPPASTRLRAVPTIAATPPFMSCEPRPYTRPLRTSGSNGRAMPATPTVSVWPHSISARPGERPFSTPTTLGRPGAASVTCTSRPIDRISSVNRRAMASSPAAPGTSDGFTESMATRSHSRRRSASGGASMRAVVQHRPAPRGTTAMNSHSSSLGPVTAVAEAIRAAGGRALVVGGWVRDRLLGRESKDLDIEVFGLPGDVLRDVLGRLGRVEPVGNSFPVFKLAGIGDSVIDVSLPRRESKAGRGHRGFVVEGDPTMSIADAARRRDFTINAIAWDPLTGAYEDPFDGRADLTRRMLRAVDPVTFGDDSLRVLRAVQFAARFEFALDEDTAAVCRRISLDDLPAERIWGEIEKLLLQARRPTIGMKLALELGVVDRVLPELRPIVGCPQDPEWHPEGDVWVHTLMVMDEARAANEDLDRPRLTAVMLGALCHDLGKPATTAMIDGRLRSPNHEQAGVAPTLSLLDRLNVHSVNGFEVRGQVVGLVAHHLKPGMFHKAAHVGDGAFRDRKSTRLN